MDRRKCNSEIKLNCLTKDDVLKLLEKSDLGEFCDFVKVKDLDGRKLLNVTEGIVKLWQPKINPKKLLIFIEDLRTNPDKYIKDIIQEEREKIGSKRISTLIINEKVLNTIMSQVNSNTNNIECQYQMINVKRIREDNFTSPSQTGVEELLKRIIPAKSFLYRNKNATKVQEKPATSYVPMDGAKKYKKLFRLSYDYPSLDWKRFRFSRQENFNDRGYYSIKTRNKNNPNATKTVDNNRSKYKSCSDVTEVNDGPEEHFYEDLCYNDVVESNIRKRSNSAVEVHHLKIPCMIKINELFNSFRLPFFRKSEETKKTEAEVTKDELPIYANDASNSSMYDSVIEKTGSDGRATKNKETQPVVEDYLEPIQLQNDYCDVMWKEKDESFFGYLLSIFGLRRETNDQYIDEDGEVSQNSHWHAHLDSEQKWSESRKGKSNMADRPLPVPIDNEPYYMNVDRGEAESMLRGQPDGVFILRPSSQPNYAYTLSVSCSEKVHNIGVRRRPDGRLALGFARKGERSFATIPSLLRYHRRRRLMLVAAGDVIGATFLKESPEYYQTPSNLPVMS